MIVDDIACSATRDASVESEDRGNFTTPFLEVLRSFGGAMFLGNAATNCLCKVHEGAVILARVSILKNHFHKGIEMLMVKRIDS